MNNPITNREAMALQTEMEEMIHNALTSRAASMRKLLDPRRDIDDECGYPKTGDIDAEMYRVMYDREGIATRVVEVEPKESWQVTPDVYETFEQEETAFEAAWNGLPKQVATSEIPSYYNDEKLSPVWEYLRRVDILSGVGHFGVLLIGLDDGKDLNERVEPRDGMKVLYLRAFDESLVHITRYDQDPTSSRYGEPVAYNLTFYEYQSNTEGVAAAGVTMQTAEVHWTRVIHVADNRGSSEVIGVPRQRPVWNRLYDLRKLYGGSAEMFWRGAFPGISLETHPMLGGDVKVDATAVRKEMIDYMEGLQRYLLSKGMTAKSLAPQVADPSNHIDAILTAICIRLGIPKRIFMGSERGELSSNQDEGAWDNRIDERRNNYLTPHVICPFVDRLIWYGVLPVPAEGYHVDWPERDYLKPKDKADIAFTLTRSIREYLSGGVQTMIPPYEQMTRFLNISEEKVAAILETALKQEVEDE